MSLQNWYPYTVTLNKNEVLCHWLDFKDIPFSNPFFDETIQTAKSHNRNLTRFRSVSELQALPLWAASTSIVKPSAFIFHVSRCGSTLLSQLLGMDHRIISLAEVPFFDNILRLPYKEVNYKRQIPELLQAGIALYGRQRHGAEEHLTIKTDSWHIFFRKQIRELYPDVPFILLYRHPQEVIRSHQKLRGLQAVPNLIEPAVFGFTKKEIANLSLDEYIARVLKKYYSAYLQTIKEDRNSFLINYAEGAEQMFQKILKLSNIELDEQSLSAMINRTKFHSKYPDKPFKEEQIQDEFPSYMHQVIDLYHQVETLRLGSEASV